MNLSTPPQPRFRPSTSSTSGNATPTTPSRQQRQFAPRAFAANGPASILRDKGTPVGKVLAREGMISSPRSPRRVRQRTWQQKARDWPSNLAMSIETSIQLLSFDRAGYPLAVGFNVLHLLTRLPVFVSALPTWMQFGSSRSRYLAAAQDLADADRRLEALRREARGPALSWGWLATSLSLLLVLVSVGNAVYLFSRRRKYTLVLKKDPLASPNARAATLDFVTPAQQPSWLSRFKHAAAQRVGLASTPEAPHSFQVQELNVWTPDYVVWSLRLFTLYPPPLALTYHFLTPSSFIPSVIVGSVLLLQSYALVSSYSQLLADRATLQAEVMHEYDTKFVKPRLFLQKRDAATSTSELEYSVWRGVEMAEEEAAAQRSAKKDQRRSIAGEYQAQERFLDSDQMDQVVRGSGRKSRKSMASGSR